MNEEFGKYNHFDRIYRWQGQLQMNSHFESVTRTNLMEVQSGM